MIITGDNIWNGLINAQDRITNSLAALNLGTAATTGHSLTIGDVIIGGALEVDGLAFFDAGVNITGTLQFAALSKISSPSDKALQLTDNAGTDFDTLIFGATNHAAIWSDTTDGFIFAKGNDSDDHVNCYARSWIAKPANSSVYRAMMHSDNSGKGAFLLESAGEVAWSSTTQAFGTPDIILSRVIAGTLGIRTTSNNPGKIQFGISTDPFDTAGTDTPEGAVTAPIGSLFRRRDGGASTTLYVKESGTGNTGWIAYGAPGGGSLTVEAKTIDYSVSTDDADKLFTNEGAAGEVIFTLPAAAAAVGPFTFYVQTAQNLQILAGAGDTIRFADDESAAAGTAESTVVGSLVSIVAINDTEYIATKTIGIWTVT